MFHLLKELCSFVVTGIEQQGTYPVSLALALRTWFILLGCHMKRIGASGSDVTQWGDCSGRQPPLLWDTLRTSNLAKDVQKIWVIPLRNWSSALLVVVYWGVCQCNAFNNRNMLCTDQACVSGIGNLCYCSNTNKVLAHSQILYLAP